MPSVNALRAFETTARLGSVTQAANELFVTPSAVSHQIRKLEDSLGLPLIEFANGKAQMTEWGNILAPGLVDGFLRIREAVSLLDDRTRVRALSIAARPFFASKWLSPRLDRFWEAHPDIGLRMRYMLEKHRDTADTVDAWIEWHREPPTGDNVVQLMLGALGPVCSPSLAPQLKGKSLPDCLDDQVLLREAHQDSWRDWFVQIGVPNYKPEHTVFLDDGAIRLQSCIAGKGIDMSVPDFLEPELEKGLLVEPFPEHRLQGHYYLVLPKFPSKEVLAFKEWILGEIAVSERPL